MQFVTSKRPREHLSPAAHGVVGEVPFCQFRRDTRPCHRERHILLHMCRHRRTHRGQPAPPADDDHSLTNLGRAVICTIQDEMLDLVIFEHAAFEECLRENYELRRLKKSRNVLEEKIGWLGSADGLRILLPQEVAMVGLRLLAERGKALTGRPSDDEVDARDVFFVEPGFNTARINDVSKVRPVALRGRGVQFDCTDGSEPVTGAVKTRGEPPRSSEEVESPDGPPRHRAALNRRRRLMGGHKFEP